MLLLDEIDLASNKIMCLQSLLEGKGVFLKKTNTYVRPAAGFNVIATANTKGRGSDDGKFIGTNVLNEAFLERFAVTFEQSYPTPATEKKILLGNFNSFVNVVPDRPGFCNIDKAVELCTNRFDDDTAKVFRELYTKIAGEQQVQQDLNDAEDKAYADDIN